MPIYSQVTSGYPTGDLVSIFSSLIQIRRKYAVCVQPLKTHHLSLMLMLSILMIWRNSGMSTAGPTVMRSLRLLMASSLLTKWQGVLQSNQKDKPLDYNYLYYWYLYLVDLHHQLKGSPRLKEREGLKSFLYSWVKCERELLPGGCQYPFPYHHHHVPILGLRIHRCCLPSLVRRGHHTRHCQTPHHTGLHPASGVALVIVAAFIASYWFYLYNNYHNSSVRCQNLAIAAWVPSAKYNS